MTDQFILALIRQLNEADYSLNKALLTKSTKERRRQLMKAGELAQDVERRIIEVLK